MDRRHDVVGQRLELEAKAQEVEKDLLETRSLNWLFFHGTHFRGQRAGQHGATQNQSKGNTMIEKLKVAMRALRNAGARDGSEVHWKDADTDQIHTYRLVFIEDENQPQWVEVIA